jgi:hypothetical protein
MTISRKALCVSYGAIGLLAVIGTWGNVLGMLGQLGFVSGTLRFWQDVLVNESSRFITIDILFLSLAVVLWMVLEARRLTIPGVWAYVVFGVLIGISLAVPLFLIHREIKLAAAEPGTPGGSLQRSDVAGLAMFGTAVTAFAVVALTR